MKENKYLGVIWIVLGAILIVCGAAGILNEYWSSMGGAFIAVGAVRMIRYVRLSKNEAYRDKIETEAKDERNRFLKGKAWAWAGYLYVFIVAFASVVMRIAGKNELATLAGGSVCMIVVLFWGSYFFLRRKY